jgi:hypothetical protein
MGKRIENRSNQELTLPVEYIDEFDEDKWGKELKWSARIDDGTVDDEGNERSASHELTQKEWEAIKDHPSIQGEEDRDNLVITEVDLRKANNSEDTDGE